MTSFQAASNNADENTFIRLGQLIRETSSSPPAVKRLLSTLGPREIEWLIEALTAPEGVMDDAIQWFNGLSPFLRQKVLHEIGQLAPRAEWALECFLPNRHLGEADAMRASVESYNSKKSGSINVDAFRDLMTIAVQLLCDEYMVSDEYVERLEAEMNGLKDDALTETMDTGSEDA